MIYLFALLLVFPGNDILTEVTQTLTTVAVNVEEDGRIRQKAIISLTELNLSESNRKLVAEKFCDIASNASDDDVDTKSLAIESLGQLTKTHAKVDAVAPDVLSRLIAVASQVDAKEKVRMKSLQTLAELNLAPESKALLVRAVLTLVSNKADENVDVKTLGIELLVPLLKSPEGM